MRRSEFVTFVISNDPVARLAEAKAALDLGDEIVLLADEGSALIRSLGLLNEQLAAQHEADGVEHDPAWEGAAHPGTFVVDSEGVVRERLFHRNYRIRPTASGLLEDLGVGGDRGAEVEATARAADVDIRVWSRDATYQDSQQINLYVDLDIPDGAHVYGPGAGGGLRGLDVSIDGPPELRHEPPQYPPATTAQDPLLDMTVPMYDARVTVRIPIAVMTSAGDVTLIVRVEYQACTASHCHRPRRVDLPVTLRRAAPPN